MILQAYSAVWADKRLKNGALIVALAIADFAWDDGWAFPSVAAIAEKARMTPRWCIQVIAVLEEMGHLVVVDGAGWKGTNLYGLTALTKGSFNPPTPSEIEAAMRMKRQPTARRRTSAGGEKKSGGVKKVQGEVKMPKSSPEPYRTLTPPKEESVPGEISGVVEWPSQDDVRREAEQYPGSPAWGIPPKIPEPWALDWWGYCTFRRQQFAPNWKEEMVFRFERDWQDGVPKARGAAAVKGKSVWELKQVLEQLKKQAADHPANENSTAYLSDLGPEEQADYEDLCRRIAAVEREIGGRAV